jgi:hypothetical protein
VLTHSTPVDPEVEQCTFMDTFGRRRCTTLIDRRHFPNGLCKYHDPDRPARPRKETKE